MFMNEFENLLMVGHNINYLYLRFFVSIVMQNHFAQNRLIAFQNHKK